MASFSRNNYNPSHKRRGGSSGHQHHGRSSYSHAEEEEFVDDLAIAASYAMAVAAVAPLVRPDDDNEIDLATVANDVDVVDDKQGDDDVKTTTKGAGVANVPAYRLDPSLIDYDSDNSSSSSSDESDAGNTDISQRLEHAEHEEEDHDDEDHAGDADNNPPKTTHEITDAAAALLLDKGLTLQEQDALGKIQQSSQSQLQQQPLHVAGLLQQYIASDRMLVVQSSSTGQVLQPGTLLVLKFPPSSSANSASNNHLDAIVVPCGKILDVFGPVRQPLYSVHVGLPESDRVKETNGAARSSGTVQNDSTSAAFTTAAVPKDVKSETKESLTDASELLNKESELPITSPPTPSTAPKSVDPWSANGSYAIFVSQAMRHKHPITLYCIPDCARVLDPTTLPRNKGCDASNAHDEEVTNPAEMDYSDDEQEQYARKGNRRGTSNQSFAQGDAQQSGRPMGNIGHHAQPLHGFHGYPQQAASSFVQQQQQHHYQQQQQHYQHQYAPQDPIAGPSAQQSNTAAAPPPDSDVVYYNF